MISLVRCSALAVIIVSIVPGAGLATSYRHATTLAKIRHLETAIGEFSQDLGRPPSSSEGLSALLQAPAGAQSWNGPYIRERRIPNDAWGKPFVYLQPSVYGDRAFDLYSSGVDGRDDFGSHDDITNWSGAPSQFYSVPVPWVELTIAAVIALVVLAAVVLATWAAVRAVLRRRSAA